MPEFQLANRNRGPSLEWAAANADRFMEHYVGGIQAAIALHQNEQEERAQNAR